MEEIQMLSVQGGGEGKGGEEAATTPHPHPKRFLPLPPTVVTREPFTPQTLTSSMIQVTSLPPLAT